jgi:hypothetical protein
MGRASARDARGQLDPATGHCHAADLLIRVRYTDESH